MNNNLKWSIYISKQIIMKRVTETFIRLLCNNKREEATHYDNNIVDNTAIIMDQWNHLIDRFWKQCQLDYYLDWLNRRITRYVKANLYQECIPMSNNPKIWIYVWIDSGEHKTENEEHLVLLSFVWKDWLLLLNINSMDLKWFCIVGFDCW